MSVSGKMYMWGERAKFIPEGAGVYALYDEDRVLIYVGGSANLRDTFARHLETNFSEDPRKRKTRYYKREFVPNWEERVRTLLEEYKQKYGELPKLNLPDMPKKDVAPERGFYFYEAFGKPLSEAAFSLEDFWEKVKKVPVASLEFHQKRGDFARWVRDVFKETQLAERIQRIVDTGESLRRQLLSVILHPHLAKCPKCGTETRLVKMWEMAGRPSKIGEKLQLTIGLYKCSNCGKTFRKAIRKEIVES
ncbi:MAG: hypothetical protein ACE5L6_05855 [Candidatus Bathyarchaeia archaeon]